MYSTSTGNFLPLPAIRPELPKIFAFLSIATAAAWQFYFDNSVFPSFFLWHRFAAGFYLAKVM